jgi:hypothetical protein
MTGIRAAAPGTSADRGARAVRAWVALYTRGLPPTLATARRDLIEADLYDEARAAERQGEIGGLRRQRLSRLLRGIPADVAWRLGQRARPNGAPKRSGMPISRGQFTGIAVVTILYLAYAGALLAWSDATYLGMGQLLLGLGLSIVGLLAAIPNPRMGLQIGLVGTLLACLAMPSLIAALPWLWPAPLLLGYRFARDRQVAPATGGDA